MIDSSLHAAIDDTVFTDRSDELCTSLETVLTKNKSMNELHLVNLRFANRLIDSIGKGVKLNKTLKILDLSGNSIVLLRNERILLGLEGSAHNL